MLSHHERVVHEAPLWDGSERGQCWSMADHVGGRKPTGGAIAAGGGGRVGYHPDREAR